MPLARDGVSVICNCCTSVRAMCSWRIKSGQYMRSVGSLFRLELCRDRSWSVLRSSPAQSRRVLPTAAHTAPGETTMLPAPGFHHLHLNSVDPDAAIDFYIRQFPTSSKTTWGGLPALKAMTNVLILFNRVASAPATAPQTAIWHFGWHVPDTRARLETY